jgi:hypothetical protein
MPAFPEIFSQFSTHTHSGENYRESVQNNFVGNVSMETLPTFIFYCTQKRNAGSSEVGSI